MKTKFSMALLLTAVLLSGCVNECTIEFLFEHNGCKMYRFYDSGKYVYWSDCQGKVQSDYTTRSGIHHVESITN